MTAPLTPQPLRPGPGRRARLRAGLCALAALAAPAVSGCGPAQEGHSSAQPTVIAATPPVPATSAPADPETGAALLRVAQAFNNAYDNGDFGAAYDRWDTRSQRLLSRADYLRRHRLCAPATHVTAIVTGATRAGGGAWHVTYQLGGQPLTDTWFYVRRRWVFDIVLSNPDAARLYRMPFAKYAAAVGCRAG